MRLIKKTMPSTFELALFGDDHDGNPARYSRGVNAVIRWLKAKPNRFGVHMGDGAESRTVDHKYYTHDKDALPVPYLQRDSMIKRFSPVKDKMLCALMGNHEESQIRILNITLDFCNKLGISYGGMTTKLRLVTEDDKQICKLFLAHPRRLTLNSRAKDEVQRTANLQASLKNRLERKASDCLIMAIGHVHKLIVLPPSEQLIMSSNDKRIKQSYLSAGDGAADYIAPDRRWYCATGSFLRTQVVEKDTYSEKYMYDPVELGYILIKVRRGKVKSVEKVVI